MIKTVLTTIFVLSAVILTGSSAPQNAYATEKEPPSILNERIQKETTQEQLVSSNFQLFLPVQQTYFLRPTTQPLLRSEKEKNHAFVAEIGESEVSDIPVTTPTPVIPTQATQQPEVAITTSAPADGNLNAGTLFSMVNATRANAGLPPFQQDERVCSVAASRGPELYGEIMVTHTMHAGFFARNLPYWATENMIYMNTEQEALSWWMGSSVHRSAILGNYQYACGTCVGKACNMIFTNFESKQQPLSTPATSTI